MSKNILTEKSFSFAIRIVKLYQFLNETKKEYVLSKQILRSGTSIWANIRESRNAESDMDFIHKLWISQKETDETLYWIELLYQTEYITEEQYLSMHTDAEELLKIIRSTILTKKKNLGKV
jgi:four helix bundle protein